METLIVAGMSAAAIAFMAMFLVAICRECRPMRAGYILRIADSEGIHIGPTVEDTGSKVAYNQEVPKPQLVKPKQGSPSTSETVAIGNQPQFRTKVR